MRAEGIAVFVIKTHSSCTRPENAASRGADVGVEHPIHRIREQNCGVKGANFGDCVESNAQCAQCASLREFFGDFS